MAGINQQIHFLVGPTAVGKTELSLQWAERLDAEIISCDAFCVYRGMDIGTAKPSAAERARVRHHCVDLVEPTIAFSVHDYLQAATRALHDIRARGRNVIVTGGSGFYLKCFFAPVVDNLKIPGSVRAQVDAWAEQGGEEALRARLLTLNPEGVGGLDLQNPRRVRAALERCLASGKTVVDLRRAFEAQPAPFSDWRKYVVQLDREPEALRARIRERVVLMLEQGLVAEVSALRDAGIEGNPTAAAAIGYRETLAFLQGDPAIPSKETLQELIATHTNQLARKQRTWFRNQIPVDRIADAATMTVTDLPA